MSDLTATYAALRTKLQDFTDLPLYWPNDDRDIELADVPEGYVYSELRMTNSEVITLGAPAVWRDTGEFEIWVMVPLGSKVGAAEAHAQAIRAMFTQTGIGDVIVLRKVVEVGQVVESNKGNWFCVPVRIDWQSDRVE